MTELQDQEVGVMNDTEEYIQPLTDRPKQGPSQWAAFVDEVILGVLR